MNSLFYKNLLFVLFFSIVCNMGKTGSKEYYLGEEDKTNNYDINNNCSDIKVCINISQDFSYIDLREVIDNEFNISEGKKKFKLILSHWDNLIDMIHKEFNSLPIDFYDL